MRWSGVMPKTRCESERPGTDGAGLTCLGFLKAGGGGWRRGLATTPLSPSLHSPG